MQQTNNTLKQKTSETRRNEETINTDSLQELFQQDPYSKFVNFYEKYKNFKKLVDEQTVDDSKLGDLIEPLNKYIEKGGETENQEIELTDQLQSIEQSLNIITESIKKERAEITSLKRGGKRSFNQEEYQDIARNIESLKIKKSNLEDIRDVYKLVSSFTDLDKKLLKMSKWVLLNDNVEPDRIRNYRQKLNDLFNPNYNSYANRKFLDWLYMEPIFKDGKYIPLGVFRENFLRLNELLKTKSVIALFGPTGSGKTSPAEAVAKFRGQDAYRLQVSNLNLDSPTELLENLSLTNNTSTKIPTAAGKIIKTGGVLILDELTKADGEKQGVFNTILGLRPGDQIEIAGELVTIPDSFRVIITGNRKNESDGGSYTVFDLNSDIEDRIGAKMEVKYPENPYTEFESTLPRVEFNNIGSDLLVEEIGEKRNEDIVNDEQTLPKFWTHEFMQIAAVKMMDNGYIKLAGAEFEKFINFMQLIYSLDSEFTISIRKFSEIIEGWVKNKTDLTREYTNLVNDKVKNTQQKEYYIKKILDRDFLYQIEEGQKSKNVYIGSSVMFKIMGIDLPIQKALSMEEKAEIEQTIVDFEAKYAKIEQAVEEKCPCPA